MEGKRRRLARLVNRSGSWGHKMAHTATLRKEWSRPLLYSIGFPEISFNSVEPRRIYRLAKAVGLIHGN